MYLSKHNSKDSIKKRGKYCRRLTTLNFHEMSERANVPYFAVKLCLQNVNMSNQFSINLNNTRRIIIYENYLKKDNYLLLTLLSWRFFSSTRSSIY